MRGRLDGQILESTDNKSGLARDVMATNLRFHLDSTTFWPSSGRKLHQILHLNLHLRGVGRAVTEHCVAMNKKLQKVLETQ
jgi:hypothetical protein